MSFGRRRGARLARTIVIALFVSAIGGSFAKINWDLVMSSSRSFASDSEAEFGQMAVSKCISVINSAKCIKSSSLISQCLNYMTSNSDVGERLFQFGTGADGNSRTTTGHFHLL